MPGRPGLRSGALLRLSDTTTRSGILRISGGGSIRFASVTSRSTFALRRGLGGSKLQGGATLRRPQDTTTLRGILRISGDGQVRFTGRTAQRGILRISGNGTIRMSGGSRSSVPATSVGSWRS